MTFFFLYGIVTLISGRNKKRLKGEKHIVMPRRTVIMSNAKSKICEITILDIARQVRRKYPHGKNKDECCSACSDMVSRFKRQQLNIKYRIRNGTFDGEPHTWVEVKWRESIKILDVTADQFGKIFKPIVWGLLGEYSQYSPYSSSDKTWSIA